MQSNHKDPSFICCFLEITKIISHFFRKKEQNPYFREYGSSSYWGQTLIGCCLRRWSFPIVLCPCESFLDDSVCKAPQTLSNRVGEQALSLYLLCETVTCPCCPFISFPQNFLERKTQNSQILFYLFLQNSQIPFSASVQNIFIVRHLLITQYEKSHTF